MESLSSPAQLTGFSMSQEGFSDNEPRGGSAWTKQFESSTTSVGSGSSPTSTTNTSTSTTKRSPSSMQWLPSWIILVIRPGGLSVLQWHHGIAMARCSGYSSSHFPQFVASRKASLSISESLNQHGQQGYPGEGLGISTPSQALLIENSWQSKNLWSSVIGVTQLG